MCYYIWNVTKTRCQKVLTFYWDSLYTFLIQWLGKSGSHDQTWKILWWHAKKCYLLYNLQVLMSVCVFFLRFGKRLVNNLSINHIHNMIPSQEKKPKGRRKEEEKEKLHWVTRAKLVIETLKTFMNSTEEFITTLHVPNTYVKNAGNVHCICDLEHDMKMVGKWFWVKFVQICRQR